MALFGRALKSGSEDGALGGDGKSRSEASSRRTIGQLLRSTRQGSGGDLERIAANLRIRASYLAAIEEGRYDRLPGLVYAVGFIRAYAVHLGLDGDEAVRQLKQEMAGFEVSRDLSFPMPLAERSIPGGTMLLAALILAICGYGLWYYVSTGNRERPERVTAVPGDIAGPSKLQGAPTPAPAAPAALTGPTTPTTSAPTASAPPDGAPPAAATSSSPVMAAAPPPSSNMAPALPPSSSSATGTVIVAPPIPAPSAAGGDGTVSSASPVTAPALVPSPADTGAASSQAATNIAPPGQDAASAGGVRVYGAPANAPARIVIHATKESWIQIRTRDDQVTVQRILHPGDSVRVPDEPGQVMRTGNALGLAIDVDGKPIRALRGTVRSLELDPEQLASPKRTTTRADQ